MSSKYQRTIYIRKIKRRLDKLPTELKLSNDLKEAILKDIFDKNVYELEILLDEVESIMSKMKAIGITI